MAAMTILGDRSLIKMILLQRRRCLVCVDSTLLIFTGVLGEDELVAALEFALSVSRPGKSPKLSLNWSHNFEAKETIKRNPSRFICLRRRARLFSIRSLALPVVCSQSCVLWQNYRCIGIFGLWSAICVRKMIGEGWEVCSRENFYANRRSFDITYILSKVTHSFRKSLMWRSASGNLWRIRLFLDTYAQLRHSSNALL